MVPPAVLALDPIAVFMHDYHSANPLRSWPPVPAERLHQGEMLAMKMFGSLLEDIRSPRHIYFASWRDPDSTGYLNGQQDKPPTSILFGAQFGVAPYETSPSLLETAEMFNRLDRAQLRLDLVRGEDGSFRLDGLEVELNAPIGEKDRHFRSVWKGEEIRTLDLSLQFDPPASRLAPFRFHLRARLPRRYNRGAAIEREHVEFTASGGAMPLPRWVNY
jgi:hypothetical protein